MFVVRLSKSGRMMWLGLGLAIGLAASVLAPHAPLHATATDRQENFCICTGAVDEFTEAVYYLDFLTGDLKAAVLSPITRKFQFLYETNILGPMGIDVTKNPKYLMVTGRIDSRKVAGNVQPSLSVVYIAELTTGKMAAYTIPWSRAAFTSNVPVRAAMMPVDIMQFRNVAVRQ